MGSIDNAPSWADQWGTGSMEDDNKKTESKKENGNNKMGKVKSVASSGLDKAKAAALFSAAKVKSGTSTGFKWVKTQYQKKSSK